LPAGARWRTATVRLPQVPRRRATRGRLSSAPHHPPSLLKIPRGTLLGKASALQHLLPQLEQRVERRADPLAGHQEVLRPDRALHLADQPCTVRPQVDPAALAGAAVALGAWDADPRDGAV
jgi:hypothetical protein